MSMCMRTLIVGAAIGIVAAVTTISPTQAGMIGAGKLQITKPAPLAEPVRAASSPEAGRLLRDAVRRIGLGKQAVYFKRHYKDGTTRPIRLSANAFVEKHLERNAESAG
jgi:hypothetical protein